MLLPVILSLLAAAATSPVSYDERQDGEFNVRADVQNVVLLVALPQKTQLPSNILDGFFKSVKPAHPTELQERSDIRVMEAFVEPNTPYRVEIGSEGDRYSEGDGRAVEVVIAGRRRMNEVQAESDDIKLLGATEQCGPDRERDPVTLACRARAAQPDAEDEPTQTEHKVDDVAVQPEVVPAAS